MIISVLISMLLQMGIISNVSEFDENKTQQYLDDITSSSIIIHDGTEI